MITNTQLVNFVKQTVGNGYCFGCWGKVFNSQIYNQKKAQYPAYYPPKSRTVESYTCLFGTRTCDCSGLIKWASWSNGNIKQDPVYRASEDLGANGMYRTATKKGTIKNFDNVPGRLVFKEKNGSMHHVGVYIGNGRVIEAKGHAYGIVESALSSGWTHWGQCSFIKEDTKPEPVEKPEAPKLPPKRGYFKIGDKGENVKQLQRCLCWLFGDDCMAPYGVDGSYGKLTAKCVTRFEKMFNGEIDIEDPGLWGKQCNSKYNSYSKEAS